MKMPHTSTVLTITAVVLALTLTGCTEDDHCEGAGRDSASITTMSMVTGRSGGSRGGGGAPRPAAPAKPAKPAKGKPGSAGGGHVDVDIDYGNCSED